MPHLQSLYPSVPDVTITNFYEWLIGLDAVKNLPDFTLFIDGLTGEKRGKREFFERVADCATAFAAPVEIGGLDITRTSGEMVGIFSENLMEYPTIVFSLLKIAVPFALLPAYSTAAELAKLIKISGITRLFISPATHSVALKAAQETGFPTERIYVLQGYIRYMKTLEDMICLVRAKGTSSALVRAVPENHLACLSFSSGTTGLPKAVMISHKNLYFSAMQPIVCNSEMAKLNKSAPYANDPQAIGVGMAFLPFYHVTAFHLSIMRILTPPCTIIILPRWNLDKVLELVEKYRVTNFGMVPSMSVQMINSPKFRKVDFSSVRGYGTGAAHLPIEHRKAVLKRLPNVKALLSSYGMTECTFIALQLPLPGLFPGRFTDEVLSSMTGILLPGMEARIVRDDGSEANYDEPGELFLRGGNVALGYWRNETATKEIFLKGGWLRTGDRFTVDINGALFYVDRLKDTLKVSGAQVSPSEIEQVLLQHPDKLIVDVTVAGVPGERFSDELVPHAWVVLSNAGRCRGSAAAVTALHEWSRTQMARHKWLRGGIEVVDQIPKSPTGKVLRRLLQEKYAKEPHVTHDVSAKL